MERSIASTATVWPKRLLSCWRRTSVIEPRIVPAASNRCDACAGRTISDRRFEPHCANDAPSGAGLKDGKGARNDQADRDQPGPNRLRGNRPEEQQCDACQQKDATICKPDRFSSCVDVATHRHDQIIADASSCGMIHPAWITA